MSKRFPITFITGNKKKLEEFLQIMTGDLNTKYDITNTAIDMDEIQGTPEQIAYRKVKLASKTVNGPAMTEDVSLCFNALGGMPGPYIKDFLTNVGREGLHKMLIGFEDKTAYALCIFAFCESPDAEPILFVGRCNGKIVAPQGDNAFGWDPVFMPDGFTETFAQISAEAKNEVSHRGNALKLVKNYLTEHYERLSKQN